MEIVQSPSTQLHPNVRLYTSLVQPHLEYAAGLEPPPIAKDIHCIDMVQKFVMRMCSKNYSKTLSCGQKNVLLHLKKKMAPVCGESAT